jgi:hypothetical protein
MLDYSLDDSQMLISTSLLDTSRGSNGVQGKSLLSFLLNTNAPQKLHLRSKRVRNEKQITINQSKCGKSHANEASILMSAKC